MRQNAGQSGVLDPLKTLGQGRPNLLLACQDVTTMLLPLAAGQLSTGGCSLESESAHLQDRKEHPGSLDLVGQARARQGTATVPPSRCGEPSSCCVCSRCVRILRMPRCSARRCEPS